MRQPYPTQPGNRNGGTVQWRCPYRAEFTDVTTFYRIMLGAVVLFTLALTGFFITAPSRGVTLTPTAVLFPYAVIVFLALIGWRFTRFGLFLSDRGIRLVGLVGRRTFAWQSLKEIKIAPERGRLLWKRDAIWLVPKTGWPYQTSILRARDGRESHHTRFGEHILEACVFDRLAAELQDHLIRAT